MLPSTKRGRISDEFVFIEKQSSADRKFVSDRREEKKNNINFDWLQTISNEEGGEEAEAEKEGGGGGEEENEEEKERKEPEDADVFVLITIKAVEVVFMVNSNGGDH